MSPILLLLIGLFTTGLCVVFVWVSIHEMRRLGQEAAESGQPPR